MTLETTQEWKIDKKGALHLLPDIPDKSINMILTDLPYGQTACEWDAIIPLEPLWEQYKRIIKDNGAIILTASQPFTTILISSNMKMFRYEWIWVKNFSGGFSSATKQPMKYHENVLVFYKKQPKYNPIFEEYAASVKKRFNEGERVNTDKQLANSSNKIHDGFGHSPHVISFERGKYPSSVQIIDGVPNCNGIRIHPTQKPLELFEYLISTYTDPGDTVHDSCLGAGTTLEACVNLNRNCMCFEISDEWEWNYKKIMDSKKNMYQLSKIFKRKC